AARDQRRRRILKEVIEVRARRTPQLQHVAKAARRDQRGARAGSLENGVGHYGGRMREQGHLGRRQPIASHRHVEGAEHAFGEVARGRRHLGHADLPARVVDESHVRECPADIDPYAPSHSAVALGVEYLLYTGCPSSVPIPKFASPCGTLSCELRNQRDTSKLMSLVWFVDLKFLCKLAANA